MSIVSSRSRALPPSIYWLSLCSFAFGLCEFIAAGLLTPMARDLHASVAAAGGAIAAYALGAAIGAPVLTAMLARRPVRQILVAAGFGAALLPASLAVSMPAGVVMLPLASGAPAPLRQLDLYMAWDPQRDSPVRERLLAQLRLSATQ